MILALVATAAALPATAGAATAARGNFARRVAIPGGRKLFLECRGHGRPTVVLEAGSGNSGRVWLAHDPGRRPILPAVARFTRVCAYDRPGTVWPGGTGQRKSRSRSDPVAMPRTAADIAGDLRALLRAAHVPGPYVLAGHSFGAMVLRLFATTHPGRVAGLVSIDAQSEWYADAYGRLLTREQYIDGIVFPPPPAGFPHDEHPEQLALAASAAEMRQAQADSPLRRMPFVVLSHSRSDPNPFGLPSSFPVAALNRAFNASQDRLAALVPGARHVDATKGGHYFLLDQPGLVVRAIRSVVERARRR